MRDLVVTENITVDGVIDATGDWFLPTEASGDLADVAEALAEQRDRADALLVGRTTFEAFREFWPAQTDDETGTSDYLNQVHKYVVSGTLGDPGWEPTTVLRGLADVRSLKQGDGGDIVTTGSLTLTTALVAAGLVDEYRLFTYPVVRGTGQRLFGGATEVPPLRLVETRSFRAGVVLLRYRTD